SPPHSAWTVPCTGSPARRRHGQRSQSPPAHRQRRRLPPWNPPAPSPAARRLADPQSPFLLVVLLAPGLSPVMTESGFPSRGVRPFAITVFARIADLFPIPAITLRSPHTRSHPQGLIAVTRWLIAS